MADLIVDYALLDNMEKSLARIARDFEGLHERRVDLEQIWGHQRMRNAMDSFADNWKVHREKITEEIAKLGESCFRTAVTFKHVDGAG